MIKFEGFVKRVFFTAEENGMSAFSLKNNEGATLKVKGVYFNPRIGEYLECGGELESDKYGEQLKATYITSKIPKISNEKELRSFLRSLGGFNQEELYEFSKITFDDESLDFLDSDSIPLCMASYDQLWYKLKDKWEEYKGIKELAQHLIAHSVDPTVAKKIYKSFGKQGLSIITDNPYRLLDNNLGDSISFKIVDDMGLKMGIVKTDPKRITAGLVALLKDSLSNGHTFLPLPELLNKLDKFLSFSDCTREVLLCIKDMRGDTLDVLKLSKTDIRVSLSWIRKAEKYCSDSLLECKNTDDPIANTPEKVEEIKGLIKDFEDSTSLSLSDEQRDAILLVFTNKVSIITGNPGTGKTTVCKCILYIFNKLGKTFSLASPTGRAAKRLAEVTGFYAETIHRLLEYSPQEGGFTINEENPLQTNFLLIDEFSMVDIFLFRHLLKGHDRKNHIVIVGDADQLPSVQAGSVLRDCINSNLFGTRHLSKIYRQDDSNLIVLNAHAINKGEKPKLLPYNKANDQISDFLYKSVEDTDEAVSEIESLYMRKIKEGNTPDSIQILSPKKEGVCGINNLNKVIQNRVNGDHTKPSITKNGILFRLGDRVLQLKNDYEKGIFNGDTGVIVHVTPEDETGGDNDAHLRIDFGIGQETFYEAKELSNLQLAYAMTIHKSQGSEYPIVIMPLMVKEHYIMLYRNLFYTGITRAKKKLYLVGQEKAVSIATKNVKNVLRYTSLFV